MAGLKSWRANRQSLTDVLEHALQSGLYSDVGFLVGSEKVRINGHKNILMLRSEVFEAMFSAKWNVDGWTTVDLPEINPTAFKAFIKFLYTDKLCEDLSMDILLEVMSLGKMYEVPILVKQVGELLFGLMQPETCVKIYEYTKLLDNDISRQAFNMFKDNLQRLLQEETYLKFGLDNYWHWETWKAVLCSDGYNVPEINLFKAVAKWSEGDESRKDHLNNRLMSLIRFPIMGVSVFNNEVVPTGLLPSDDIIHLFLFFTDVDKKFGLEELRFSFKSRDVNEVSNSQELLEALGTVQEGGLIQLLEGIYEGPFQLDNNFITIRGLGEKTAITTHRTFPAALGIEVSGKYNTLENIQFEGLSRCELCVVVNGDGNLLQDLIMVAEGHGFEINGHSNLMKNTWFERLHGAGGIRIYGNNNEIDGLKSLGSDADYIVRLHGNGNKIRNMKYDSENISDIDNRVGVGILAGKDHVIDNLTCADDYTGDTLLQLEHGTANVSVSNAVSGMEVVVKGRGHKLLNIVAKNKIEVEGSGHRFESCHTDEWDIQGDNNVNKHQFIKCNNDV